MPTQFLQGLKDWYSGLPEAQRYALAGGLVGGGTLGALNMMKADRGKRVRGLLGGLAVGGLGGAAAGLGANLIGGDAIGRGLREFGQGAQDYWNWFTNTTPPTPPAEGKQPGGGAAGVGLGGQGDAAAESKASPGKDLVMDPVKGPGTDLPPAPPVDKPPDPTAISAYAGQLDQGVRHGAGAVLLGGAGYLGGAGVRGLLSGDKFTQAHKSLLGDLAANRGRLAQMRLDADATLGSGRVPATPGRPTPWQPYSHPNVENWLAKRPDARDLHSEQQALAKLINRQSAGDRLMRQHGVGKAIWEGVLGKERPYLSGRYLGRVGGLAGLGAYGLSQLFPKPKPQGGGQ